MVIPDRVCACLFTDPMNDIGTCTKCMVKRGERVPHMIQMLAMWLMIASSTWAYMTFFDLKNLLLDSTNNTNTRNLISEYYHMTDLSLLLACKVFITLLAIIFYTRNIPKVVQRLREKSDKKRGTASKSTKETYLDALSTAVAHEAVRRRIVPDNISLFDNNGLRPFVQVVLMVLGTIIVLATNSMLLLPGIMLVDKLFKFKALRYILCQTLGTNPVYTINEETLDVRAKVAAEPNIQEIKSQ